KDRDRRIHDIEGSATWKLLKPLWKLERHFSAARDENSTSANRVFAVDTPDSLSTDDVLTITGWCYARTGAQVVGVRAKIGRKSYLAKYGLKREDAAGVAVHGPPALYSGFAIEVPICEATQRARARATAPTRPWTCVTA